MEYFKATTEMPLVSWGLHGDLNWYVNASFRYTSEYKEDTLEAD
jgi:hypothetical protein